MKKLFILLLCLPIEALTHDLHSSFRVNNKCYGNIYREKYIPGDAKNNGYIKKSNDIIRIPCINHEIRVKNVYLKKNKYKEFVKDKFSSLHEFFNRKFADLKLNHSKYFKN